MARATRRSTKVVVVVVIAAVVVWLLFTVVFPWVDRRLSDPVLGSVPGDITRLVVDARA